jgi:hypothetical protein
MIDPFVGEPGVVEETDSRIDVSMREPFR